MQSWWWRSVAACASVLLVAGLVSLFAVAVTADRATSVRLATDGSVATGGTPAPPPTEGAPASPANRVTSPAAAASVDAPGWRPVTRQSVIEVPAGRFDTVLARGDATVLLVGRVDPARVPDAADAASADRAALQAEARRLADAYADILAPDADRVVALSDDDRTIGDLPAFTSVRRVAGGGDVDGAIVRVSTAAAPGRTVAVLAVARPGPTQGADATDAEAVARSLRPDPPPAS
jgi:hypothetical protein